MKIFSLYLLLLFNLNSYSFELLSGDLLFQVEGDSDFSHAITKSTTSEEIFNFIHVAIVDVDEKGNINIIEASPNQGVQKISLNDFLESSPTVNGKPGVLVKRIKYEIPQNDIIKTAKGYIGQSYDWYFLPDNGLMYCSELVYESYLDKNGKHIFSNSPMNFRTSDGTIPEFWIQLFENLGVEIPEGIPGTNPNDLSKEPILIEIGKFF